MGGGGGGGDTQSCSIEHKTAVVVFSSFFQFFFPLWQYCSDSDMEEFFHSDRSAD